MSRPQRAVKIACVAKLVQAARKACTVTRKIQHVEFLAIFFCDFFSCCISCARLATYAVSTAHWRRNNFPKKIASPSQAKNRWCPAALYPGLCACIVHISYHAQSDSIPWFILTVKLYERIYIIIVEWTFLGTWQTVGHTVQHVLLHVLSLNVWTATSFPRFLLLKPQVSTAWSSCLYMADYDAP